MKMLIQARDKHVEELEQKLKRMEDQLRAVEGNRPDSNPWYEVRGLKTPESDQLHPETCYLTSNIPGDDLLGPDSTFFGRSSQASDLAGPPQNSNCNLFWNVLS